MNKIDKLTQELCPEGVRTCKLIEIAEFTNNGIDKKIKDGEEEVGLLNFKDVFNLKRITAKDISTVTTVPVEKKSNVLIKKHDIYLTPSSEVKGEIGMTSVVSEDIPDTVYSYHIARIRIRNFKEVNPYFLSYLFYAPDIRNQINQNSQGMTRYGLTKPKWEALRFPLPPIEIQNEIVRILDQFTELETELEAELESELEARKKQIRFYKDKIFSADYEVIALGKLCETFSGTFVIKTKQDDSFEYPVYNGGITPTGFYSEYNAEKDSIAISARGASRGFVNWVNTKFWAGNSCHVVTVNSNKIINRYLYHFLKYCENDLNALGKTGSIPALNLEPLLKFQVKVPTLEKQLEVIEILDKFNDIETSFNSDLPAEGEARKKQYEYYRDKLLTFKELETL